MLFLRVGIALSQAAVLQNAEFEAGDLSGWTTVSESMSFSLETNETFNRNGAARLSGGYGGSAWVTPLTDPLPHLPISPQLKHPSTPVY